VAEVLSQSQIDALLSAVRSGEKDLEEEEEEQPEKKYRKYDFYSPRKFTKDRIKMLSSIFENYTRIISSRINGLLHTNCEVEVESIEEQRYYEFSNALTEGDVLTVAQVFLKDKAEDTPILIYLSTPVALSMMDHMMGGEGNVEDDLPSDYMFTDLELRLYETIVEDLVSVMGSSWENYIKIRFDYSRTEVNPTLVQLISLEETVMIVDLNIKFTNSSGRMSICLPGMVLTNIFTEINRENPSLKTTAENNSEEIFDSLRDSSLEVIAELGSTHLLLSDVYHLSVGDVIDLGHSKESPVYLNIGGYHWFQGRIGTHKKNMAVKIDEVCYQAERRSE